MRADRGLIALIGVFCFAYAMLGFVMLGRVNRFIILVLAASFFCMGLAVGCIAWDTVQLGLAPSGGRGGASRVAYDENPAVFLITSALVWLATPALFAFSGYLLRIAFMRRRRRRYPGS